MNNVCITIVVASSHINNLFDELFIELPKICPTYRIEIINKEIQLHLGQTKELLAYINLLLQNLEEYVITSSDESDYYFRTSIYRKHLNKTMTTEVYHDENSGNSLTHYLKNI